MVYFNLKGKDWPSQDIKRGEAQRKATFVSMSEHYRKESQAIQDAIKHQEILRETDAKYYDKDGNTKTVDFREDPNAKEIIKIGNEVKAMKRCGESRERIDRELNPEVAKYARHK